MEVQLIKNYRKLRVGQFAVLQDGVANILIKRGFCKAVEPVAAADASDAAAFDSAIKEGSRPFKPKRK